MCIVIHVKAGTQEYIGGPECQSPPNLCEVMVNGLLNLTIITTSSSYECQCYSKVSAHHLLEVRKQCGMQKSHLKIVGTKLILGSVCAFQNIAT